MHAIQNMCLAEMRMSGPVISSERGGGRRERKSFESYRITESLRMEIFKIESNYQP